MIPIPVLHGIPKYVCTSYLCFCSIPVLFRAGFSSQKLGNDWYICLWSIWIIEMGREIWLEYPWSAILDHQNGLHCWYQSKGKATISCLFRFEKMHLLSETNGKIDHCKVLENQTSGMFRMLKVSRKSYAGLIDQELFLANHDFYFFMLIGQYKIYDLSFINSLQG